MERNTKGKSCPQQNIYHEELFLKNAALVNKDAWESHIIALREKTLSSTTTSTSEKQHAWKDAFTNAILARAQHAQMHNKKIGVLFSGGVDSTLIAFVLAQHNIPFTCFCVGYQDENTKMPEDIVHARAIAEHYHWACITSIATLRDAQHLIEKTAALLEEHATPITVGVGAVVVAGCELARAHDVQALFAGLGSEEIFAGYERHEKTFVAGDEKALHDECWRGLLLMYDRDLIRDTRIFSSYNIEAYTPFLDPAVIISAMNLPAREKLVAEHKKYILRVMAEELGLAHEYAFRPKRAAQYGSRFDSALEKLGAPHGSKTNYLAQLRKNTLQHKHTPTHRDA